jgi:hypothetical protein
VRIISRNAHNSLYVGGCSDVRWASLHWVVSGPVRSSADYIAEGVSLCTGT